MSGDGGDPMGAGAGAGASAGADPAGWAGLAERAADSVNTRFGHRLLGLPGTWLGAVAVPAARRPLPWSQWHYWWQGHYLDAVVDSGFRALDAADRPAARDALRLARHLLRGILLRNGGRFPNYFYDDMAWLALAAGRLSALSLRLTGAPSPSGERAARALTRQLVGGHDDVLGGGIHWSRKRDYKNTPANGPAALHFARIGDQSRARALVDWLHAELFDPELGLYLDGIHPSATGRDVERTVYTYNQGPILAALLELDHPRYVDRAAGLIDAVARHLTVPAGAGGAGAGPAPAARPLRRE
ncbi:glycoside hydrolase family 76 protein, partial [Specibacter sp. RAF43]|uniref:glycoside hydrolase family 76 protein n=1 Tax=Specibacter sp. RAF43 TaxID=3233057 RepID=UPI003F9AD871